MVPIYRRRVAFDPSESENVMPQASERIDAEPASASPAKTARHRVERTKARARYEREAIHAILDDGLVAHVAFSIDAQPFVIPMLYARDGERLIVVGTNFGQAAHPAWTANLIKQPDAVLIMGGRRIPVRAELLDGDEAERAYGLMRELADVYSVYRTRTDRQIRVFALHRAG